MQAGQERGSTVAGASRLEPARAHHTVVQLAMAGGQKRQQCCPDCLTLYAAGRQRPRHLHIFACTAYKRSSSVHLVCCGQVAVCQRHCTANTLDGLVDEARHPACRWKQGEQQTYEAGVQVFACRAWRTAAGQRCRTHCCWYVDKLGAQSTTLTRCCGLDEVLNVSSVRGPVVAKHASVGVGVEGVVHAKALQLRWEADVQVRQH